MGNERGYVGYLMIMVVGFMLFCAVGWGMNIVKLIKCDFKEPYKAEVIRVVGVIPVVGAITGWIDIEDGNNSIENEGGK